MAVPEERKRGSCISRLDWLLPTLHQGFQSNCIASHQVDTDCHWSSIPVGTRNSKHHSGYSSEHYKLLPSSSSPIQPFHTFSTPILQVSPSVQYFNRIRVRAFNRSLSLSKKMNDAETRYPVHEQELLAIVTALSTWNHYLMGAELKVLTDHKSLIYFQTQPMLSGRQTRWLETLSRFSFTIEYIKGPSNVVADAFSRRSDLNNGNIPLDRPPTFVDSKGRDPISNSAQLRYCRVFTATADTLES